MRWDRALTGPRQAYVGMEPDQALRFTPIDHPDPRVQRIGFDLNHPYVEQCWSALIGPSSTLLLRRLPALWVARVPAEIDPAELSRSLGLGSGTSTQSRFVSTLQRVVRFGLATPAPTGAGLDVYRQVPPLTPRQLERLPQWTRDAHERLFGAHLDQIDHRADHQAGIASVTARLDRLQHRPTTSTTSVAPHGQALGR